MSADASWPVLAGEWVGRYPGHHDEFIRITQEEAILTAVKITGDSHVPAGEITWTADLRTGEGQGQIAEEEFRNPRFVPGKLHVFDAERLRFVWQSLGYVDYRKDD
jgi:hypothetical protein